MGKNEFLDSKRAVRAYLMEFAPADVEGNIVPKGIKRTPDGTRCEYLTAHGQTFEARHDGKWIHVQNTKDPKKRTFSYLRAGFQVSA